MPGPILSAIAAAAPLIGAGLDFFSGRQQQASNLASQREFAQHGIRWRVEDAKAAGLHPLYALGAQTHQFAPSMVGTNFAGAGQDISSSIHATRTSSEREAAGTLGALQLERAGLENELLRSQIAGSKAALLRGVGPPMPDATPDERVGPAYWNDNLFLGANPTSSAQTMENNYGEMVGDTWGAMNFMGQALPRWILEQSLAVAVEKKRREMGLPIRGVGIGVKQRGY